MAKTRRERTDAMRTRVSGARTSARESGIGAAWGRLPPRVRRWVPALVALAIPAAYPLYSDSLPTNVPVILNFPSVRTAVVMFVFMIMALGLNVVVGYAGLLDLGYVAFYAVGAYTAGWLASGHFNQVQLPPRLGRDHADARGIHVSIWFALIAAGLVTALAGILIGLPTLRLRGDYLAIVTLGFGEIIPQFVRNADSLGGFNLTNGSFGINPIDSPGFGADPQRLARAPDHVSAVFRARQPLLLVDLRHLPDHGLLLRPPARLATRPSLDRDPGRRVRRRRDGRSAHADEDVGLRARRVLRRDRGRVLRELQGRTRSRASSSSTSRSSCSAWSCSAAWARSGASAWPARCSHG